MEKKSVARARRLKRFVQVGSQATDQGSGYGREWSGRLKVENEEESSPDEYNLALPLPNDSLATTAATTPVLPDLLNAALGQP